MVGEDHRGWAFSLLVLIATHQSNSEAKEMSVAPGVTMLRHSACGHLCPLAPEYCQLELFRPWAAYAFALWPQ